MSTVTAALAILVRLPDATRRGFVHAPKAPKVAQVSGAKAPSAPQHGYHGWFVFMGGPKPGGGSASFSHAAVNAALNAKRLSGAQRELLTNVRNRLISLLAGANHPAAQQLRAGAIQLQKKLNAGTASGTASKVGSGHRTGASRQHSGAKGAGQKRGGGGRKTPAPHSGRHRAAKRATAALAWTVQCAATLRQG